MQRNGRSYRSLSIPGSIRIAALLLMTFDLAGASMWSQVATPSAHTTEATAAAWAFDTASIKPSDPNARGPEGGNFPATGFRAIDFPLSGIVFMAYYPLIARGHQLIGMPAWGNKERYDVVAHIDEASAPAWLKLAPLQRQEPGRLMLQKLLADRCKLIAHTVPTQIDGYMLVVSKGGPHLTPTKTDEVYPAEAKNSGDGSKVVLTTAADGSHVESFFNATIKQLTDEFELRSDSSIQDHTNLTGRYDFTIRRIDARDAEGKRISDPQPNDMWDLSGTGLEIRPAKIASENLVIDHIERPSPN